VIGDFVSQKREEDLHLDFKAVGAPTLATDDRKNLAIALSGFANSDGGIAVWGVDARPNADGIDCAVAAPGVSNAQLCLTKLNEFTGQCVSPLVDGVEHRAIQAGGAAGFCVSLIPASQSSPHMAKAREDRYFKRNGSAFYRLEHFDLEDLFGRRPKPVIRLASRIRGGGTGSSVTGRSYGAEVIIGLQNEGRGLARFPYLKLRVAHPYQIDRYGLDGNGNEGLSRITSIGDGTVLYGASLDIVIHPKVVLDITKVGFHIHVGDNGKISPVSDLRLEYELAAEGAPLSAGELTITAADFLASILPRDR
jgi:hypothetical protein